MNSDIIEYQLKNGLRVTLKEIHNAPLVSHWLWYQVGSRNEVQGKTGVSHWVEHMQFKGNKKYSAQRMDHAIARTGGYWNAFTGEDFTTYFETLPASAIDLAMKIEAERMRGSLFATKEVETERTVILSEREGNENEPRFRLSEAVQQASYRQHPYRNEVLGHKADLLSISRDDLFEHYQANYHPSNARLCIAGDFKAAEILKKVERYYGAIPASSSQTHQPIPEPEAPEYQEIEQFGPGEASFMQLSYRCPEASHEDFFALSILDSLLAGPSSLNMFGSGGISNRTSQLYLALVDKGYAASVSGGLNPNIDPGTYVLSLTCASNFKPRNLLKYLDREIEKLQAKPVAESAIKRAQKQAKALFAYGSDNITNQAFWMGYAPVFADYNWFLNYVERLNAVTSADLMRVANQYLDPQKRVVGFYLPGNGAQS